MLLRFSVENFRSFKSEETLNLIPVQSRIHPRHIQTSDEKGRKTRSLPLAVLYGANASGKSNLIRTMAYAQKLIIEGTRGDSLTGAEPFRLDPPDHWHHFLFTNMPHRVLQSIHPNKRA